MTITDTTYSRNGSYPFDPSATYELVEYPSLNDFVYAGTGFRHVPSGRIARFSSTSPGGRIARFGSTSPGDIHEYVAELFEEFRAGRRSTWYFTDPDDNATVIRALYTPEEPGAAEVPAHHRALADYLRSRERDFGRMSDLAYEVITNHKQAFTELTDFVDDARWGASNDDRWTNAYRTVLDKVPAAGDDRKDGEVPEAAEDVRTAQGRAMAALRRREAELQSRLEMEERKAKQAREALHALQDRVENLNDALNEQVVDRGWCSEFEEFVSNFDDILSVKRQEVTVTMTISLDRRTDANNYGVADVIYDMSSSDIAEAIIDIDEMV